MFQVSGSAAEPTSFADCRRLSADYDDVVRALREEQMQEERQRLSASSHNVAIVHLRRQGEIGRQIKGIRSRQYAAASECRAKVRARTEEKWAEERAKAATQRKRDEAAARSLPSKLSGELLRLGYKDALFKEWRKLRRSAPAVGKGLLGYRLAKDTTGLLSDGGGWLIRFIAASNWLVNVADAEGLLPKPNPDEAPVTLRPRGLPL